MNKNIDFKIHNRFDIEVIDAKTGEVRQRAQAFNLICDTAWTSIFSTHQAASDILYGSGSGTPSRSDTQLFHYLGAAGNSYLIGASDLYDWSDEANGIIIRNLCRVLDASVAVGDTITEVGLGRPNSGSNHVIYTHAMLQDMNGNPISIVKTNTDIINFYSKTYLHFNQDGDIHIGMSDNPYVVENNSVIYGSFVRDLLRFCGGSLNSAHENGIYLAKSRCGNCAPMATISLGNTSLAYDLEHKTMKLSKVRFGVGDLAVHGAGVIQYRRSVSVSTYGYGSEDFLWIESGKTTIPPFAITSESVGVGDGITTKFKTKTDFPYNATVYVNGEPANGVTVHKYPTVSFSSSNSSTNNPGTYFQQRYDRNLDIPCLDRASNVSSGEQWLSSNRIYYNNLWEIGLYKVRYSGSGTIEMSNDGTTWHTITLTSGTDRDYIFDSTESHYKFIKFTGTFSRNPYFFINDYDGYNIIFTMPPANGAVITIDYTTDYIPKDSDHVLDVEVTFTFGEWSGE